MPWLTNRSLACVFGDRCTRIRVFIISPAFSRIAASAAALSDKHLVSAETFTCIYGYKPALHMKNENILDLKLLVDALFVNGINTIVWHGMPFTGNEFYATVYVGEEGSLTKHLMEFNKYIKNICDYMQQGVTYRDIAIYLPIEDNWINYEYPDNLKCPGGMYYYDLRYIESSNKLNGYHPLWISGYFLKDFKKYGFRSLYVDVKWLDNDSLSQILTLAESGMLIFINNLPKQPGYKKDTCYEKNLSKLLSHPNTHKNIDIFLKNQLKLVESNDKNLLYWCRVIDDNFSYIFFAHPKCSYIKYPMKYNLSHMTKVISIDIIINIFDNSYKTTLVFKPNHSILIKVDRYKLGIIEFISIEKNHLLYSVGTSA